MTAVGKRRLLIRLALLVCIVAVAFTMYRIGKEFNVLLDNETVTIDGKEYPMLDYALLTIDRDDAGELEIYADDRIIRKMVGSSHRFVLKVMDEDDETVIKTVERTIKLDRDVSAWMISLAALAGDAEVIFVPNPALSDSEDDEPEEDEETSPSEVTEETPPVE